MLNHITFYGVSLQGDRPYQEDSIGSCITADSAIFVAADGLGGHGHGEDASSLAVDHSLKRWEEVKSLMHPSDFFKNIFSEVGNKLIDLQDEEGDPTAFRTTMNLGIIDRDHVFHSAHVGDSRCYVFKNGKLIRQSVDHSIPQMLVSSGNLKKSQIRNHPDRNRLYRVLGQRDSAVECTEEEPVRLERGMCILLCTDGFWEMITEKQMQWLQFWSGTAKDWILKMVRYIEKNGQGRNMDNFSAIAVWIE